jgi:hypothetical protein
MGNQETVLGEVRARAAERGVTSGFYDNAAELYKYMTSVRNLAYEFLLKSMRELRKGEKFYEPECLKDAIKDKNFNLGNGTVDYDIVSTLLITDFKAVYSLELCTNNDGNLYPAAELTDKERRERQKNPFSQAKHTMPTFSRKKKTISISPAPTAAVTNGGLLKYYPELPEITASVDTGLGSEMNNVLIEGTLWKAMEQDGQYGYAKGYKEEFYNQLQLLI